MRLLLGCLCLFIAAACSPDDSVEDGVESAADSSVVVDDNGTAGDVDRDSQSEATNADAAIISFVVDSWQKGFYQGAVERFEEENPDLKIEFVSVDEVMGSQEAFYEDPNAGMLALAQNGDVISTFFPPNQQFEGIYLDLGPLIDADSALDRTDFYNGALDMFSQSGRTYAIPTSIGFQLIFYDKALFDRAGVPYPEIGWSWDDFLATAQALTVQSGSETTQYGFSPLWDGPMSLVAAKTGQQIFNPTTNPPTLNISDPEMVAAFEWYVSLFNEYGVAPRPDFPTSEADFESEDFVDPYQLVEEGIVAMYPDNSDSFIWRSEQNENLGVAPFPISNEGDRSTPMVSYSGQPLAISAGTQKSEEAWRFVSFLLQQPPDPDNNFGPQGGLPSQRSVAEASGYFEAQDPSFAETIRYAADHSFTLTFPYVGGDAFFEGMNKLMEEDSPNVAQILSEIESGYADEIAELGIEDGPATPVPDFTVAEPPSRQIDPDATVVTFVVAGGDPSFFRNVAEQFEEQNPGIVIKIEEPNFFTEDFSLAGQVSNADCFQWWGPVLSQTDLESVLTVQPFFDADPEISESDFFPAAIEPLRQNGQVIGLPSSVQMQFLAYNKRVFDAAGVDYPQPGWTLDQFLEAAVAVTTEGPDDEKVYGFVPDLFETGMIMSFVAIQGAEMFDRSADPMRVSFNSPEFASAVRWYTNLSTEYGVKPAFDFDPNDFSSNVWELREGIILSDRAGIWPFEGDPGMIEISIGGPVEEGGETPDTSHIGVVPYPTGPGGTGGFSASQGYYITADTELRQPCWEWIKFLTTIPIEYGGIPSRISTAESAEYAEMVGAEQAAIMVETLKQSEPGGSFFEDEAFNSWIGGSFQFFDLAVQDILSGEVSVEEGLQVAQDNADTFRQCIIEKDLVDSDDWQEFEGCMMEVDPDIYDR